MPFLKWRHISMRMSVGKPASINHRCLAIPAEHYSRPGNGPGFASTKAVDRERRLSLFPGLEFLNNQRESARTEQGDGGNDEGQPGHRVVKYRMQAGTEAGQADQPGNGAEDSEKGESNEGEWVTAHAGSLIEHRAGVNWITQMACRRTIGEFDVLIIRLSARPLLNAGNARIFRQKPDKAINERPSPPAPRISRL